MSSLISYLDWLENTLWKAVTDKWYSHFLTLFWLFPDWAVNIKASTCATSETCQTTRSCQRFAILQPISQPENQSIDQCFQATLKASRLHIQIGDPVQLFPMLWRFFPTLDPQVLISHTFLYVVIGIIKFSFPRSTFLLAGEPKKRRLSQRKL